MDKGNSVKMKRFVDQQKRKTSVTKRTKLSFEIFICCWIVKRRVGKPRLGPLRRVS